jgi:hypothetical protein
MQQFGRFQTEADISRVYEYIGLVVRTPGYIRRVHRPTQNESVGFGSSAVRVAPRTPAARTGARPARS